VNIEFKIQISALNFLLALNIVIFIIAFLLDSSIGFDGNLFYLLGGQISTKITSGSLWLLTTANFFHIELIHFIFNIISLYRIGQLVEYYYDGKKLFTVYILGGIGGVLTSYLVSILTNQNVFSLGASASIFALVGFLLGGTFRRNRYGKDLPFSTRDLLPFVLIAFVFGFMPGLNINNWAHLGGLISGILLGLLIPNSLVRTNNKIENYITKFLFWLSVIIFILSYGGLIFNAYNLLIK